MHSTHDITDTSPEAEAVLLECIRRIAPIERLEKALALSNQIKRMTLAAIRRRHADFDEDEVRLKFIELTYGKTLSDDVRLAGGRWESLNEIDNIVDALYPVVSVLRDLQIRHFVGGSVASSFHGATRSTMDVDVVCEMKGGQIPAFVSRFGADFYLSESAIREAVQRKSCFNLIHLSTSFKVDVFISRQRPFDLDSMNRATTERLSPDRTLEVPVATAEDSIIAKLESYRKTNETSDRQWSDVTQLIKLLGNTLNLEYLKSAAESVAVRDLLERLLASTNTLDDE
jgi:hypothetical protein